MNAGHYELKHQGNAILSWSHGSRLRRAVTLVKRLPGGRLLDFGAGDGVLERMLSEDPAWTGSVVAADVDAVQIQEARERNRHLPKTSFVTLSELSGQPPFQIIVCLEVLEHVVETEAVLDYLDSLLTPGGNLVISVPVETGFVLAAKQMIRSCLGGDYRYTERYSPSEFWSAFVPNSRKHARPTYETLPGFPNHGHKLFNWRWLRSVVRQKFVLEEEFGTPYPLFSSQRWFVCRKKS